MGFYRFFTRPISSEESCGAKQGFGNRTTLWGLQWLGQVGAKASPTECVIVDNCGITVG